MSMDVSPGSDAAHSKAQRPARGRDRCEPAQDDTAAPTNKEPPHGHVSHGVGYFLSQIDPDTLTDEGWIPEVAERFQRWKAEQEQRQDTLGRWSP